MGQSLGGVVAQVIASRHPEVVEGLVLSNTCSPVSYTHLDVYKRQHDNHLHNPQDRGKDTNGYEISCL